MAERFDPVELELFSNRLVAVAEEMGTVLCQAGFSPNIKERRDFSCAIFDAAGGMVSHAAHIPVHLGSTPLSVKAAIEAMTADSGDVIAGDIMLLNDPYSGGTHLPDLTVVAPVFLAGHDKASRAGRARRPFAWLAARAHHADVGGHAPGSMALCTDIHQEGFRIPPVHLYRGGRVVRETMELFLANTRVPAERMGDLDAQVAALRSGDQRLSELATRFGPGQITRAMKELQDYSRRLVEAMIKELPIGEFSARDSLDNDGIDPQPLRLSVTLRRRGKRLEIDLRDCAPQCRGPLNANLAVTTSAVFYVVACLAGSRVPANRGMMEPVDILTTPGTLVDCRFPAAVAGGNVETSQRIVDLLLRALARALPGRIPAASSGTMNNLTLGGWDVKRDRHFAYYETVAGGAGAGPSGPGCHALHTHMTNTLNTPVELLESYYPLRVIRYGLRRRSGGTGKHRGGDGIDREIEVLVPATLTLLADRRQEGPWGLAGGKPGLPGRDTVSSGGRTKAIASKTELQLAAGDRVRVQTPGGGGWGRVGRKVAGKKKRG